jgi:hypothetical protein
MLQVYVINILSVSYGCCIQMYHVARVSYYLESQQVQGVVVARHGRRRMGHGELEADGRGAKGVGAHAGRGGWFRI